MRICIIDNYDSFTYNLKHYLEEFAEVEVYQHDELNLDDLKAFDGLVLSPGPGLPKQKANLMELIKRYHGRIPILGVCLGMQALAIHYQADLLNMGKVLHGKKSTAQVDTNSVLFYQMQEEQEVGHYHSWMIDESKLPTKLRLTAIGNNQLPLAMECIEDKVFAIQFHPESVLTPNGKQMLRNWCNWLAKA